MGLVSLPFSQVSPFEICCTQSGSGAGFPLISPVSIITPMPHTLHLHVAFTRRTNGRSLGTFTPGNAVPQIEEHWLERYFALLYAVVRQAERCDRYGGTPSATTTSKGSVLPSKVHFTHLCREIYVNSCDIVYCGLNRDRSLNTGPPVEALTEQLRQSPQLLEISYLTCLGGSPRRAFVINVFSCSELSPAV